MPIAIGIYQYIMHPTIKAELEQVLALLRQEWEEDLRQYNEKIKNLPLHERIQAGACWHPLMIIDQGFGIGDRAYVVVERNSNLDTSHRFRSGQSVSLFTTTDHVSQPDQSGIIHYVKKQRMKIILNSKDLPDWLNKGNIGVDLLFDERSYKEMEKAMTTLLEAKKSRTKELVNILYGRLEPEFETWTNPVKIDYLNTAQNNAVTKILSAKDVVVLHGPPGTGKTTTLVRAIAKLSQKEHNILVCAPSNAAVDLLTERLAEQGLNVVRIGNISRIDEEIISHTLDYQISKHPESKNIKKVKQEAAKHRREARRYKRNFGRREREERNEHYKEARELSAWANQLEDRIVDQILTGANVICSTLVGVTGRYIDEMKFKTVFIDEAAQALEPATWIPILKAKKVVLAGDPFQLPPTVKSIDAQRKGFGITLMEKSLTRLPEVHLLNVQYRMNQAIMGFSNTVFYDHKLIAADTVKDHTLALTNGENLPLEFIDTAGCGFMEQMEEEHQSRYNPDEFKILREHLYQLLAATEEDKMPTIGIISPYRKQVEYIKEALEHDPDISEKIKVDVNTIDGFQGQERDVIYISMVRSNDSGTIGFLKDYRRMNVAMTRAKKKLVIVGDSGTLGSDKFYQQFLDYSDTVNGYRSAWEFMAG